MYRVGVSNGRGIKGGPDSAPCRSGWKAHRFKTGRELCGNNLATPGKFLSTPRHARIAPSHGGGLACAAESAIVSAKVRVAVGMGHRTGDSASRNAACQ